MYKHIIMICFLTLFTLGCQSIDSIQPDHKEKETTTETESPKENDFSKEQVEKESIPAESTNQTQQKQTGNSPENQGELIVDFIDVGQGDATLFQYRDKNENYTILYDTGDWLGDEVVPFLQEEGIECIDLVIISHPHADHIGQLKKVMQTFEVDEVWMSGNTANSNVFNEALQAVLDSDAEYVEPRAGDIFDIGPLTMTVLHPDILTEKLNEDSLSIHVAYNDVSFLFTGDAGKKEEHMMMDREIPLKADYLQLGHHGSNTSSAADFIDAVEPSKAIYSAGVDNKYGHPYEEVVSLFEKKGIDLYGTDVHGTITITTDGQTSTLETDKEGKQSSQKTATNSKDQDIICIDLNTATEEDLTDIQHIGDARAKEIIAMRPLKSIDDLIDVKGIGDARLKAIKQENKACIGGD